MKLLPARGALAGLLLLGLVSRGSSPLSHDEREEPGYPTTLYPLPPDSLRALKAAFAESNPGVATTFDGYGWPRWDWTRWRGAGAGLDEEHVDLARMLRQAKDFVVANRTFTNVPDTSHLSVEHMSLDPRRGLSVMFSDQLYEGLPVVSDLGIQLAIRVVLDSLRVVFLEGRWLKHVQIPFVDRVRPGGASQYADQRLLHGQASVWRASRGRGPGGDCQSGAVRQGAGGAVEEDEG